MRINTMEIVINKEFDKFVRSIDDKKVQELVMNNTIITGGCFVSLWNNDEVNDYDLYFRNKETVKAVAEYYVKKRGGGVDEKQCADFHIVEEDDRIKIFIKSLGIIKEHSKPSGSYQPAYYTDNAITLTDKIQLILRFYGEPEDIHSNYDFIHTTNYWTSWERKVVMNIAALDCIQNKTLIYQGSKYPIATLIRTRKFIQRGWHINAGQYLKIAWQIKDLDLTDIKVLQDQLMGVDSYYFMKVIEKLKENGTMANISNDYLIELIDEVFNAERIKQEVEEEPPQF